MANGTLKRAGTFIGGSVYKVRFVGRGRAGSSLSLALEAAGWEIAGHLGRGDPLARAAQGVDALVIATPDREVAPVARAVEPEEATVVLHLAGSLGLDSLSPHPRRASLHPLAPLPGGPAGARRLASGIFFAVAGDPLAARMASALGGTPLEVAEGDRAAYHAAACAASNHLVALMGQVQRLAQALGLPLGAFLPLARAALEDVESSGPRGALTGPAARGDASTLEAHRLALAELAGAGRLAAEDLDAHLALSALAGRLAGQAELAGARCS